MTKAISSREPRRWSTAASPASRRGRHANMVARVLAAAAAILAVGAGGSVVPGLSSVDQDLLMLEAWRAVGFLTFAALFVLLAARPLHSPALWLILLGNKLALSIIGVSFGAAVRGAHQAAAWDGALVAILLIGFAAAAVARRVRPRNQDAEE